MRLLEFVLQGVPGVGGASRVRFGAGTSVLDANGRPVQFGRLLAHSLYNENLEPAEDLYDPSAQVSRTALTVQDHSSQLYRVIRDLRSGSVQLSRYVAEQKTFATVSSRPAEVGQYLRSQARLASEDVFRDLLWIHQGQLPSQWRPPVEDKRPRPMRRPMAVMGGAAAAARYEREASSASAEKRQTPLNPGGMSLRLAAEARRSVQSDPYAGVPIEDLRGKLDDLERQQGLLDEADALQFEMDGKQRELFELEVKARKLVEIEKLLSGLTHEVQEHAGLSAVGEDIVKKICAYDRHVDRLEKALERIDDDRALLRERLAAPGGESPRKSKFFQSGVAATVIFTALGIFLEPTRWMLFLNPLPLGVVAFALLEWITKMEDSEKLDGRLARLDERAETARTDFDNDTKDVRAAMKRLGLSSTEELQERDRARRALQDKREALSVELASMQSSKEYASLNEEMATLEREIEDQEERLLSYGAVGINPMDIMREMEEIRASMDRRQAGHDGDAPLDTSSLEELASVDLDGKEEGATGALGETMPDPLPSLLSRLGDALLSPPSDAGESVRPRASQFIGALTAGRYTSVSFDGRGGGLICESKDKGLSPWDMVPLDDRDIIYLGVRLAFAEAVVRKSQQVILIEQPFGTTDTGCWPILARIVRNIGTLSQVLHVAPDPYWAQHADLVVSVGAS